jgi:hypothetical protein
LAGFLPLLSKIGGRTAAIFAANQFLFSAGFELFCRIFGRLATVVGFQLKVVY